MRSSSVVVALLLAGACGGSVVAPPSDVDRPIQTSPSTALGDASADSVYDADSHADSRADADVDATDARPVDASRDVADAACAYPVDGFILADLDTPCFSGPTGREVLAMFPPLETSTFTPSGPPFGTTWTGSLTPSPLTMTFTYAAGKITCKPWPPHDCGMPQWPVACGCPEAEFYELDVEVAATFQTADGAFDEQLAATVTVTPFAQGTVAWTASLPAADLHGTYPPVFGAGETLDFNGPSVPSLSGTLVETEGTTTGGGGTWGQ